ncbi:MAG TPA: hypothetical protein VFJ16_30190 [Longimicrobium sp.]|nr:hypothetical protein [Longimicrobium sp.]
MAYLSSGRGLDDYVDWKRDIVFRDTAASSAIKVFFDLAGYVVADGGQTRVRVYSPSAELIWSRGKPGPGPSEFMRLRSAVRTAGGEVIALDNAGKLVVYDSAGNYRTTLRTGLMPTYGVRLLDPSTLLISGRRAGDLDSPLLHLFDLRTGSVRSSFFTTPPHPPRFDAAYRFNGWANAAVIGRDTLAVVFALSDTLYLHRFDGSPIGKLPLRLRGFRPIRTPAPRNDSPEAEIEWRNSYTTMSDVFPGPDHSLFVQYFNEKQVELAWGLARVRLGAGGIEQEFDLPETLRLLGVSLPDYSLYFLRLDSLESVTWSVGQIAR